MGPRGSTEQQCRRATVCAERKGSLQPTTVESCVGSGEGRAVYGIEIEILEGRGGQLRMEGGKIVYPELEKEGICAWMYQGDGKHSYQPGLRLTYPDDAGKICPWLMDSMSGFIHVLRCGGTLEWEYRGTPYEKVIDPVGVTTEYVRCPDPTASGIVVKITRTWTAD